LNEPNAAASIAPSLIRRCPTQPLDGHNPCASVHRRRKGSVVGGSMASAEHEPITERGSGDRALSGVEGQSSWSAESILVIGCPTEPANLAPVRENCMFCYGPLVSESGGGGRVHGAPQPRHWEGASAPPGSAAYAPVPCACVCVVMKDVSTETGTTFTITVPCRIRRSLNLSVRKADPDLNTAASPALDASEDEKSPNF